MDGSVVANLIVHVGADISDAMSGLDQVDRRVQDSGANFGGAAGVMAAGAGGILAGLTAATMAAGDFQSVMNEVGAVSGATGAEFQNLSQLALQIGADTVFGANEGAQAIAELSKAGVSVANILEGAAAGAANLAAAGGVGIPRAAEVMANAMNTFSISGERATDVADIFAAAANQSAADVNSLALGLAQVGPAAGGLGLSLEDTISALALFSDYGMQGSDAGTSLKTMLSSLTPNSKAARAEMERLGFSAFDAAGTFVGMDEVAQRLFDSMRDLSQEQRALALETIFGSDASRAAELLFRSQEAAVLGTGDAYSAYRTAVEASGQSTDVANAKMAGMNGALEELRGSLETATIVVGDRFAGAVEAAADAAGGVVDRFLELDSGTQDLIANGALAVAVVLGIGAALGTVVAIGAPVVTALLAIAGPLAILTAAGAALVLAWQTNFLGIQELAGSLAGVFGRVVDAAGGFLRTFQDLTNRGFNPLEAAVRSLNGIFRTVFGAGNPVSRFASGAIGSLIDFGRNIEQHLQGPLDAVGDTVRNVGNAFERGGLSRALETLGRMLPRLGQELGGLATSLRDWVLEVAAPRVIELAGNIAGQVGGWLRDRLGEAGVLVRRFTDWVLNVAAPATGEAVGNFAGWIGDRLADAGLTLANFKDWALEVGVPATGAALGTIAGWIGDRIADAAPLVDNFRRWTLEVGVPAVGAALGTIGGWIGDRVADAAPLVANFRAWTMEVGVPEAGAALGAVGSWVRDRVADLGVTLANFRDWALEVGAPAAGAALGSIGGWIGDRVADARLTLANFRDWVLEVGIPGAGAALASIGGWIGDRLADARLTLANFKDWVLEVGVPNVGAALGTIGGWIGDRLADARLTIANFTDWVLEVGVPAAGDILEATAGALNTALQDFVTGLMANPDSTVTTGTVPVTVSDWEVANPEEAEASFWERLGSTIRGWQPPTGEDLFQFGAKIGALVRQGLEAVTLTGADFQNLMDEIETRFSEAVLKIGGALVGGIAAAIGGGMVGFAFGEEVSWDIFIGAMEASITDGLDRSATFGKAVLEKVVGLINAAGTGIANAPATFGAFAGDVAGGIQDAITNANPANWLTGENSPMPDIIGGLLGSFTTAWNDLAVPFFNGAGGVKQKILDQFATAGEWLKDAGAAIIQGLIDGIGSKFEDLGTALNNVGQFIVDNKGPVERDRRLLVPAGQAIMEGLAASMLAGVERSLAPALASVTAAIPGLLGQPAGLPLAAGITTVAPTAWPQQQGSGSGFPAPAPVASGGAPAGQASSGQTVVHQTNHFHVSLRDIEELVEAGRFVRDLDEARTLYVGVG